MVDAVEARPSSTLEEQPSGREHLGELVTRAATQLSALVKDEIQLARAELATKARHARAGAGLVGGGALVACYGLAALVAAAIAALVLVWPAWLAALVVGVGLLVVAGVLALAGRSHLRRAVPPVPDETAQSVRADVAALGAAVDDRHPR